MRGRLGRIESVTREDTAALSRDVSRDAENPLGLDETTIPGGPYLRLRLIGEPPAVYGQIAAAFDELFEHADHDPTRPLIEFYRREGEVDCLVPVKAAAVLSTKH